MSIIMVQPVSRQPADKVFNWRSTLAEQLRPVIFLLSATIPYGIGVKTSVEKPEITYKYEARKRPLLLTYSLGLLFWIAFCVCIQNFNIALDIPFPIDLVALKSPGNTSGEVTLSQSTNRLSLATVASCRLLELIGIFFSAPLLAKWLNELTAMEMDFNTHFSRLGLRMNVNISRLRNYLAAFYLTGPGAFWLVGYLWTFLPQYHFNWEYSALGYIWYFSITFYLMVPELMEDMKMILMLEISRRVYSQIRNGICQEVSTEEIKKENVVTWDGIITKLRRHVKLTGECIKTQLILNICETVFVFSFGTCLIIRSVGGLNRGTNMGYTIIAGFYCVVMAVRLYVKVAIAESIYTEERLLMEDLRDSELRVRVNSLEPRHELRNLQQSLIFAPTRIQIGSYFDLDNKLLVQVIIQTISILIAVEQFYAAG